MIRYVIGDATAPQGPGVRIIAHVTNNSGGWGRGFVLAISRRWRRPERDYRETNPILGNVTFSWVEASIWVANMCAQNGYTSRARPVAVDYHALGLCLDRVAVRARELQASVHCPRIGAGLGGGHWPTIEGLLTRRLVAEGVPVTVYDLP